MLDASDIQRCRDTVNLAMPGTAVIQSRAQVSDGMGGMTNSYAATGTVDARLDYMSADEMVVAGRMTEVAHYMLTVPHDTTITEAGRVTFAGVTYDIESVLPVEPWNLCQRAEVVRIA